MQAAMAGTVYNLTADVKLHNLSTDVYTLIIPAMPCQIARAERAQRGRYNEAVESDPEDAVMRCAPNDLLRRGLTVQIVTVNGEPATPTQALSYRILTVDDEDGIGAEYRCGLALLGGG
jgi:hypothetical protein